MLKQWQGMVLSWTSEEYGRSRWLTRVDLEHQDFSRSDVLRSGVPRSDADFGCSGSAIVRLLGGICVTWGENLIPPTPVMLYNEE